MQPMTFAAKASRWFARITLLFVGAALLLASGVALLMFLLSLVASASWLWGVGGAAASTAGLALGVVCLRRALRYPRPPAVMLARPVRMREIFLGVGLLLVAIALVFRGTGPLGQYLAGGTPLLIIALTPVVVVIHELGHVLAGALVGFRFQFVQAGPVQVARTPAGVRLRWNQPLPDDVLGLQSSLPDGDVVSIPRLVAHAAGGPLLNLATAALAYGVSSAVSPDRGAVAEAFLTVVRLVGVFSGLAVVNLIPFRTPRGRLTDGALIIHYLRTGSPALSAFMRASRRQALAERPREWAIEARTLATWADAPAPTGPWLLLFALGVALDKGDQVLARELLTRAESVQEPTARFELTRQAILVDALKGDAPRARERLEAMGKPPWAPGYSALAEAALLVAEARGQEAREALDRWDRFVAASPPGVRVGNEWAEEAVRARIDAALAVASEQTGS
jgi:hypothetical protein